MNKLLAEHLQPYNFIIEIQNTIACIGIAHNHSQKNGLSKLISVLNKINSAVNLAETDFTNTVIIKHSNIDFFTINQGKLLSLFEQPVKGFLEFLHLDKKERLIYAQEYLTNRIHTICNNKHKFYINSCTTSFNIILKKNDPIFAVIHDGLINLGFSANNITEENRWLTYKLSIDINLILSRLTDKNLSSQFLAGVIGFYNDSSEKEEKPKYISCL